MSRCAKNSLAALREMDRKIDGRTTTSLGDGSEGHWVLAVVLFQTLD